MKDFLLIASVLLGSVSAIVYIDAILRGEAKPHRTTRLVFLFISTLTSLALLAQGNQTAIWLSLVSTVQSTVIFLLSLKLGMGGWGKTDIICLLVAILSIILWQTTKDPMLALYFTLTADFIGFLPALIKTYHFPKTEVWTFYFLDVCAAMLNIFAAAELNFSQSLYPTYIIFANLTMTILIFRPKITLLNKIETNSKAPKITDLDTQ